MFRRAAAFSIVLTVAMSVAVVALDSYAASPTETILDDLRNYDQTMADDVSLVARATWRVFKTDPDSEEKTQTIELTRSHTTWALKALPVPGIKPPTYSDSAQKAGASFVFQDDDLDASGNIFVSRRTYLAMLGVLDEHLGYYERSRSLMVTPSNVITEWNGEGQSVVLITPDSPLMYDELLLTFLGTGRGFSLLLEEALDARPRGDGILACRFAGTIPNMVRQEYIWELDIDVNAGFLVTRAAATVRGASPGTDPTLLLEMSGRLTNEKGTFAKRARMAKFLDILHMYRGDGFNEIVFDEIREGSDSALIEEVKTAVLGPYPDGISVFDSRHHKSLNYFTQSGDNPK